MYAPFNYRITPGVFVTLILIGTTDADKALKNGQYGKYYHTAMGKCQAIWNAVNRSSKAADSLESICCDKKLIIPCPTRWNSKYDAIVRLLEHKDRLDKIAEALKLPKKQELKLNFSVNTSRQWSLWRSLLIRCKVM